jgi:hypothetical protein
MGFFFFFFFNVFGLIGLILLGLIILGPYFRGLKFLWKKKIIFRPYFFKKKLGLKLK